MKRGIRVFDIVLVVLISFWALMIIVPFWNVIAISFTTNREFAENPMLMFPLHPTLQNFKNLIDDGRVFVGYWTTIRVVLIGVPFNLLLTTCFAFALSQRNFPGRKFFFYVVLITMLFNGGIIPMYLIMMRMKLINTLWSIILVSGINTFYMIIMRNFFSSIPDSLIESAKLDGANEWRILARIILPLSMPIIATMTLFYTVDRWNEWYNAMIFIRSPDMQPLQLVLRAIVLEAQMVEMMSLTGGVDVDRGNEFVNGLQMASILVTMLPVMCVYPFVQKHFVKGVMVGAIKS